MGVKFIFGENHGCWNVWYCRKHRVVTIKYHQITSEKSSPSGTYWKQFKIWHWTWLEDSGCVFYWSKTSEFGIGKRLWIPWLQRRNGKTHCRETARWTERPTTLLLLAECKIPKENLSTKQNNDHLGQGKTMKRYRPREFYWIRCLFLCESVLCVTSYHLFLG